MDNDLTNVDKGSLIFRLLPIGLPEKDARSARHSRFDRHYTRWVLVPPEHGLLLDLAHRNVDSGYIPSTPRESVCYFGYMAFRCDHAKSWLSGIIQIDPHNQG